MIHIHSGDEDIDCLIETTEKDMGSGMPWDDSPDNIVEVKTFKMSGVVLIEEEARKLDKWLVDYVNIKKEAQNESGDGKNRLMEVESFLEALRNSKRT